ncbi:MAG: hypothetical protein IBX66_12705, partial [Lutibacter sp.]|nr:hypothetical protein [Lutibacter sp.]
MKNCFLLIFGLVVISFSAKAQTLKSPSEFLGYELGSQFTRHHKVVDYFMYLG